MNGESRTADYLALNPAGQIPALELDDGRVLSQSNAIIQYLAEGSPLLPSVPYAKAQVNEMLFWEQYSHEPYVAVSRFAMLYLGKPKEAREAWRVERGEAALDFMEHRLADRRWLAADNFTVADIGLLAYTRLAPEGGFDLQARGNLRGWIGRAEEKLGLDS